MNITTFKRYFINFFRSYIFKLFYSINFEMFVTKIMFFFYFREIPTD